VSSLRQINTSFRPAKAIEYTASHLMQRLRSRGTVVVAVHFRFEPDAARHKYAGTPDVFVERVLQLLTKLSERNGDLRPLIYFVTALPLRALKRHPALKSVRRRFSKVVMVNKESLGAVLHKFTYINAALDFEMSVLADYFIGSTKSSFAAFVALTRRMENHTISTSTVLVPPQRDDQVCKSDGLHLVDWMFELSIPYNDCYPNDPCRTLHHSTPVPERDLKELPGSCQYDTNRTTIPEQYLQPRAKPPLSCNGKTCLLCSGNTFLRRTCLEEVGAVQRYDSIGAGDSTLDDRFVMHEQ